MEYRDTGLPPNEADVIKAFMTWRLNEKSFSEQTGLPGDYPVNVAKIMSANGGTPGLVALSLLMGVPPDAWGLMEKRFGEKTLQNLEEAAKHARTGYAYIDTASDDIKALALASAIMCFDRYIHNASQVSNIGAMAQMGKLSEEALVKMLAPETRVYDRMGDKISSTPYPALEQAYLEKRAEYRDARVEQNQALAEMGVPGADDDDSEVYGVPFEMSGLYDAPDVRNAYALLVGDSRVDVVHLARAVSVGRLMSEVEGEKDPAAIAASIIDAGIPRRTPDDNEFLAHKLSSDVTGILENYVMSKACTTPSDTLAEAPPAVRQATMANGIVLLDLARKNIEATMGAISDRFEGNEAVQQMVKARMLMPLRSLCAVISQAVEPIVGRTGAPQLEQIFHTEIEHVQQFVAQHMPEGPATTGPIVFRFSSKPGPGMGG